VPIEEVEADPDFVDPPEPLEGGGTSGRRRLAGAVRDRLPPTLLASRWSLDGRSVLVLVVSAALAVGVAVVFFAGSPPSEAIVTPAFTPSTGAVTAGTAAEASASPASTATSAAVLVVHVAGLVARPGVYEVPAGSRVVDAIEAAGGAMEGADLSQLNLARLLTDGEQVAVGVPPAPDQLGQGTVPGSAAPAAPLDLNQATESELDTLPGVGPVLAARIVIWRQENGTFSSVDELLEVSGIGEATLRDIAPLVRV